MKTEHITNVETNSKRRKFFGWLIGAVAGGFAIKNWVPRFTEVKNKPQEKKQTISVNIHPLAVARKKDRES